MKLVEETRQVDIEEKAHFHDSSLGNGRIKLMLTCIYLQNKTEFSSSNQVI